MSREYIRVNTAMPWVPMFKRNTAAATQDTQNRPVMRRAAQYSTKVAARIHRKLGSSPAQGRGTPGNRHSKVYTRQ